MKKRFLSHILEMKSHLTDPETKDILKKLEEKISEEDFAPRPGDFPLPESYPQRDDSFALFTDGACRGNPGEGAWAGMLQDQSGKVLFEVSGYDPHTTNNIMELQAVCEGLKYFKSEVRESKKSSLYCYSDSNYVVQGANQWLKNWKRKNWKKADGATISNLELWQEYSDLEQDFAELKFFWVKGHSGHPQNEYCDQLANRILDEAHP